MLKRAGTVRLIVTPQSFIISGSGKVGVKVGTCRFSSEGELLPTSYLIDGAEGFKLGLGDVFYAGNTEFRVRQCDPLTVVYCTASPDGRSSESFSSGVEKSLAKQGTYRGHGMDLPANAKANGSSNGGSSSPYSGKTGTFVVEKSTFVVGRSADADCTVSDRELSRLHFAIHKNSRSHGLHDLHSTNGTYFSVQTSKSFGSPDSSSSSSSSSSFSYPSSENYSRLMIGSDFVVGRTGFKLCRYQWGSKECQGARKTMEDKMLYRDHLLYSHSDGSVGGMGTDQPTVQLNLDIQAKNVAANTALGAVFDGHGGSECSEYLSLYFVKYVREAIITSPGLLDILSFIQTPGQADPQDHEVVIGEGGHDPVSSWVRKLLSKAFAKLDEEFISGSTCPSAGATCSSFLMVGRRLFCANVGDSRVVLCRNRGRAVEMTSDHKPTREDEAKRVKDAGGVILHRRVMGELAISRAFGDNSFKGGIKTMLTEGGADDDGHSDDDGYGEDFTAPLVIAEPEITEIDINPSLDEFILLACDGLFDVYTSADAVSFARRELIARKGDPAMVADLLCKDAIDVRGSRDNVSIMIVILRPFWRDS